MRRYVLPLVLFGAAGLLVVVLVKMGEDPDRPTRPDAGEPEEVDRPEPGPEPDDWRDQPRDTRVSLEENRWLSELERVLGREDLSRARYFRARLCENLDPVLADEEQTAVLLDLIRENGLESDDPERRDVVLPILRVLDHPEATRMIEQEYYRARDDAERAMLLEAMSHPYHDPQRAGVWAVETALSSENPEWRDRAFEVIRHYSEDDELIYRVGRQIYEASTRPGQRQEVLDAISKLGQTVPEAVAFLRARLSNPRSDEILTVIGQIGAWGDEREMARLDQLGEEFPAMAEIFEEQKRTLRDALKERRRIEAGLPPSDDPEPDTPPLPDEG